MAMVKVKCPYCGSEEVCHCMEKIAQGNRGICVETNLVRARHFRWNIKITHAGLECMRKS